MFNVLRFIVIVVTALVVFGWSLVAAEENKFTSVMVSTSHETTSETNQSKNERVQIDALTQLPIRPRTDRAMNGSPGRRKIQRKFRKPKLDLTPKFSRPDFGATPPLSNKSVAVNVFDAQMGRPIVQNRDWPSERGLIERRSFAVDTIDGHSLISKFAISAPAANIAVVRVERWSKPPPQATQSKSVSLRPVGLNYQALREKIDAHNLSVAAIEEQIRSQNRWDVESIELVVEQAEQVIADQSLWSMYLDLLKPGKRRKIGRVNSLNAPLNTLRERIFEARVDVDVDDRASYVAKTKAKQRLEKLDQQVQEWLRP